MRRKEIRQQTLTKRDLLTDRELVEKSSAVMENLFCLDEMQGRPTVLFYASFKSEVQTGAGLKRSLENGMRVALPLCLPDKKLLKPYLIKDPSEELRSGYCSIPEPIPSITRAADPGGLDIVVVPGSVFDLSGGRLGYGGGFYDRFLADQARSAFRVALAFEIQVVEEGLPLETHDQAMDCLVTEKRVLRFKKQKFK